MSQKAIDLPSNDGGIGDDEMNVDGDDDSMRRCSSISDAIDVDDDQSKVNEHAAAASCQQRSRINIASAYAVTDTFASLS